MPKANVNGINIYYKVKGKGEPLVLIMGFAAPRYAWLPQTLFLSKYFKVIAFDNRGVGLSDKPAGLYSTEMMADDVAGLLDYLKIESAHVFGISMGGMIAQEFAIKYPHRVKKLILGCTCAKFENEIISPQLLELEGMSANDYIDGKRMKKLIRDIAVLSFKNKILKFFAWLFSFIYVSVLMQGKYRNGIIGQLGAALRHDAIGRLQQIKNQTLIVYGTADAVINPEASQIIYKHLDENYRHIKSIANGSHYFALEKWRATNRIILNFLKKKNLD